VQEPDNEASEDIALQELVRASMRVSEASFARVWSNPDNDVYNDIT
jgi:hypothetical protein